MVWRMFSSTHKDKTEGKLAPDWEGPFRVVDSLHNRVYKLEELGGKLIPKMWNAMHLKMYYS